MLNKSRQQRQSPAPPAGAAQNPRKTAVTRDGAGAPAAWPSLPPLGAGERYAWFSLSQLPFLALYLLFALLLLGAGRGDFWLDEIWSLSFGQEAHKLTDLFKMHHDNNNILNSAYLFLVKNQGSFLVYRLLSIAAGVGTIVLMGHVTRRDWGYRAGLLSVALLCTCYPALVYFSEARGYGLAMFFAMAGYAALRRNMLAARPARVLLFWAVSILGILSHPIFAIASIALAMMHAAAALRAEGPLQRRLASGALHHGLPFAFIAGWYLYFMRDMKVGAAPVNDKLQVLTQGACYLLGIPEAGPLPAAALLLVLGAVALGAVLLARDRRMHWAFFPAVLVLSPALLLGINRPTYFYFRYFCVGYAFFCMLLAYIGCRCYSAWPKPGRAALIALGLLMLAGQCARIYPLETLGRGSYKEALTCILKNSAGPRISVTSDHDFRAVMMFTFYTPRLTLEGKSFHYVREAQWAAQPPEWFILHSLEVGFKPEGQIELPHVAGAYELFKEYRYSGLSGWHWFLYHKLPGQPNRLQ